MIKTGVALQVVAAGLPGGIMFTEVVIGGYEPASGGDPQRGLSTGDGGAVERVIYYCIVTGFSENSFLKEVGLQKICILLEIFY